MTNSYMWLGAEIQLGYCPFYSCVLSCQALEQE